MEHFFQQIFSGIANGMIYGALGLALVMIHKATNQINFAQGEMATFSTYMAWVFLDYGFPFWVAFAMTLIFSFFMGLIVERLFYKKVEHASDLIKVVMFIGLFLLFNGLSGFIFGPDIKFFPSPFNDVQMLKNSYVSPHQLGIIFVIIIVLALLFLFFRFTRLGLAMRASAEDPTMSALIGIPSSWMLALGWGMAALVGAIAGILVAPVLFLDPNMMLSVLTYSFAATVLGGISNPLGTVAGGLIIGVTENLLGNYIPFIGNELKLSAVLFLIAILLLIKPSGLFEKHLQDRV
jgi:branched-chain amino acid transport system permease protein